MGRKRKIYIENDSLALVKRLQRDARAEWENWCDPQTERGYNSAMRTSRHSYCRHRPRQRWVASILRKADNRHIGTVGLSPADSEPEIAVSLFATYRYQGYGTAALRLATIFCFETLQLAQLFASCHEENPAGLHMLQKCGFVPYMQGHTPQTHFITGEPLVQWEFMLANPANAFYAPLPDMREPLAAAQQQR